MKKSTIKSCKDKVRYDSVAEAIFGIKRLCARKQSSLKMKYYKCPVCNDFHITKTKNYYRYMDSYIDKKLDLQGKRFEVKLPNEEKVKRTKRMRKQSLKFIPMK